MPATRYRNCSFMWGWVKPAPVVDADCYDGPTLPDPRGAAMGALLLAINESHRNPSRASG